jgi:hypothetical protein
LRELLIQAADAAAKSSDLEQRLFETVALAACTSDRAFETKCSGSSNSTELAELELLVSQANENDVEHDCFMKPSSWDKQLGWHCRAKATKPITPLRMRWGWDVSHHTRIFPRGGEKFFLTSSS